MKPKRILGRLMRGNRDGAEIELIRPLVDQEFYLANNPDVAAAGIDPVRHYYLHGWKEGRNPAPDFSTRDYLDRHPALLSQGTNPLLHHARALRARATTADPSISSAQLQEQAKALRPHFDADYYRAQYPDVVAADMDPLTHYLTHGWREGRNPTSGFSTRDYVSTYKDVSEAGINPFLHYVNYGRAEGRSARPQASQPAPKPEKPSEAGPATDTKAAPEVIGSIEDIRPHFNSQFYLSRNQDVADAGVDPVEHYWNAGWREGRDPTPDFSTRHYLESNPDLAEQAQVINPFWHYVVAGRAEGRSALHPGGYRVEQLRHTEPLETSIKAWRKKIDPGLLLAGEDLEALILAQGRAQTGGLVIATGHDNYLVVSGGVQFCIQLEERMAESRGASYLNIHPWQALPRLAHVEEDPDPIMVLVLDGEKVGMARMSEVIAAAGRLRPQLKQIRVVIHQLLGHLPEQVSELAAACGPGECWFWVHDYFSLCPDVTLRRNGVSYCGAPPVSSNSCTLCRFGAERVPHLARMKAFFDAVDVHVVAPSEVALQLWKARGDLRAASESVLPHMKLTLVPRDDAEAADAEAPITIGFLGTPAPHKGWNVFDRLTGRFGQDPGFRFVFFGSATPPMIAGSRVPVHVTAEDPDAMIDAVEAEQCDLVLHWATWPETFSLSTFEAYSGGAWVLTNAISGNVAATVQASGRGAILESEADLQAFFEDGQAAEMVARLRAERAAKRVEHALSGMIYDIWDAGQAATGKETV